MPLLTEFERTGICHPGSASAVGGVFGLALKFVSGLGFLALICAALWRF